MASTITWQELRGLAAFEAEKGWAVSLYLGLDPASAPTIADAHARFNSLLTEGEKAEGASGRTLSHEQRQALRSDFDRVRRFVEEDFDRDGAKGLAVFSAGLDELWRTLPLADAVPNAVKVDRRFHLSPLVPLVERGEGAVVVVIGREHGRFLRLRGGRLEEIADHFEEQPRRHDQGGWSQARYQRHIDGLAQEHLRAVADELDRLVRRLRKPQVVIVSSEENWAEFSTLLTPESRGSVVGRRHGDPQATPAELLTLAEPVLEQARTERESEILARWREEVGRDGRASAGWEATLEAASDGRVELLLYGEGSNRPAWRCPACGRVSASEGTCPLDGTRLAEEEDGIDLAVHRVLAQGGTARVVGGQDLDPLGGIGALLRY